jgi:Raf kinase inhibitor-like YbhB/YbcL family protein
MLRVSLLSAALLLAAACSSTTTIVPGNASSSGGGDDAGTDAAVPAGPFTLTSTAFEEGGAIPASHTCMSGTSPALEWTGAPADTKSFAIVLNDVSTSFLHSIIYDIPKDLTGLPANVQKAYMPTNVPGAKQTRAYSNNFGYAGPCPNSKHSYEFVLYALDVEALPNMTMSTTLAAGQTEIKKHVVESTKLTGTFTP